MMVDRLPMLFALATGIALVPLASADATRVSPEAVSQASRSVAANDGPRFVVNEDKRPSTPGKPDPTIVSPESLVRPCVRSGDRVTC